MPMSDNRGRYGSLSDWLYKFVANVAQWDAADWRKREQIEMALRLIKQLENMHDKEEKEQKVERVFEWDMRRQERPQKKRANVVKLVTEGKDAS
jgi:formyltetrahydrofolate hydrolase